jgi:tRNA(fMet)-specific endonuclease VapC
VKYLLDTDHITILQRQSGPEFAVLSARIHQVNRSDLAFSVVSFHEQVLGAHAYINRSRSASEVVRGYAMLARVLRQFASAAVLPYDVTAAATFDGLGAHRLRVGVMDLRIASIALSRGFVVLTRNTVDFAKVPGLIIEDWTV